MDPTKLEKLVFTVVRGGRYMIYTKKKKKILKGHVEEDLSLGMEFVVYMSVNMHLYY